MTTALFEPLGPRGRKHAAIVTAVVCILLAALVAGAVFQLNAKGQLSGELWSVLLDPDLQQLLLDGAVATGEAAFTGLLLSLVGGVLLAAALMSSQGVWKILLRAWIEFIRGLPVLLLIFCIYLGAPALGFSLPPFWALVVALAVLNSAVFAEVFRAGITSLPDGQREAGYAIGLDRGETLRLILLPQAIQRMLPLLVSQSVVLLKETSFGFIIGYTELLREGRSAVEFLGGRYSLPIYTTLAIAYIVCNLSLSSFSTWLNKRFG